MQGRSSFFYSILLTLSLVTYSFCASAVNKHADEKTDNSVNKEEKIHYDKDGHNPEYDHEAFLGEEAKTFDQLTPEESRRRLGLIVDKIDSDLDGFVTNEELKDWIRYTQKKTRRDSVDRSWQTYNLENSEKLSWEDYSKRMYGFMKDTSEAELNELEDGISYKGLYDRDRRRWTAADLDGDDSLTKEEFASFLHPDETPHMRDLIVLETIEDTDKDKDGKISLKEYIGDLYPLEEGQEEPEWIQNERQNFATYRDKDGDGYMNEEEVKNWIVPQDFDHADNEARHLIYESDKDADQKLTKEEILANYDLFVGSQATDFGDVFLRHDEF